MSITDRGKRAPRRAGPLSPAWLPFVCALALWFSTESIWIFTSPGSVVPMWYVCAYGDAALFCLTAFVSKWLDASDRTGRVLVGLTFVIATIIGVSVGYVYYHQQQFDYWRHHGVEYH